MFYKQVEVLDITSGSEQPYHITIEMRMRFAKS